MESVINRIIEIDKQAEERLSSAEIRQKKIFRDAENECRQLEEKISHDAEKRISEIEKINRREYEELSEKLSKKYADEILSMDSFFEDNHENIENQIFAEIVGEVS